MKKGATSKRYSEAFRRQAVLDIEQGRMTIAETRRRYGITGGETVVKWLRRYGGAVPAGAAVPSNETLATSRKVLSLEREKRDGRETGTPGAD